MAGTRRRNQAAEVDDTTYFGWADSDAKKEPRQKLREAMEAYADKHGRFPTRCLTSPKEATDLEAPTRKFPGELPLELQSRGDIGRYKYFLEEHA